MKRSTSYIRINTKDSEVLWTQTDSIPDFVKAKLDEGLTVSVWGRYTYCTDVESAQKVIAEKNEELGFDVDISELDITLESADVEPVIESADETPADVEPVIESADETPADVEPVIESADETPADVEPVIESADETPADVEPVIESADETPADVEPVIEPTDETPAVVEPVIEPTDETPAVVEPVIEPTDETPAVVEPADEDKIHLYVRHHSHPVKEGTSNVRGSRGVHKFLINKILGYERTGEKPEELSFTINQYTSRNRDLKRILEDTKVAVLHNEMPSIKQMDESAETSKWKWQRELWGDGERLGTVAYSTLNPQIVTEGEFEARSELAAKLKVTKLAMEVDSENIGEDDITPSDTWKAPWSTLTPGDEFYKTDEDYGDNRPSSHEAIRLTKVA